MMKSDLPAKRFGTYQSTFKISSMMLFLSLAYPNPRTNKSRILTFLALLLILTPVALIGFIDVYNSLLRGDMHNITRHTTILGPLLGGLVKAPCVAMSVLEGYYILKEIDHDFSCYNGLPESYQDIVEADIKYTKKYSEMGWSIVVAVAVLTYPSASVFLNIKSQLFDENPRRYMVHDMVVPVIEPEDRFESPLFEIMYGFMLFVCLLYVITYIGYETFFAISVNHACLKIKIFCKSFEDALKIRNPRKRYEAIGDVVKQQTRFYDYVDKIQSFFNIYLGIVLFGTLIQIGTCLYTFTESDHFDPQYAVIVWGTVGAIYYPCVHASNLKAMAEDAAVSFYCAGWENVHDASTRSTVLFMIARAQRPVELLGFNCVVYDMALFVSILKSSYSIYTLLCS